MEPLSVRQNSVRTLQRFLGVPLTLYVSLGHDKRVCQIISTELTAELDSDPTDTDIRETMRGNSRCCQVAVR